MNARRPVQTPQRETASHGDGVTRLASSAYEAPIDGPPVTASTYVANAVRTEILRGVFRLGARLDQQALAQRYNVSIIPVREGLKLLEAQGLVRTEQRRGTYVAELSVQELTEITLIRERLEGLAVSLATPRIPAATLDILEELNTRMDNVRDDDPPSVWRDLNREWHFVIYSASGAALLLQMIGTLWDRTSIYREVLANTPTVRCASVAQHAEVLGELRRGDAAGATRAIRRHVRRGQRDMRVAEIGFGTNEK